MNWRPDEIATHRFSLTFLGFHSGEVRRALLDISATLDHARTALAAETLDCAALERSLEASQRATQETIRVLRDRLAAARATLAAYEGLERALERERLFAEALTHLFRATRATATGPQGTRLPD